MAKNSKTVLIVVIAAVVLVIGIFVIRDVILRRPSIVHCPDGSHPSIDLRDFTTRQWTYSLKLEASVADKAKVSTQLDPKVLAHVSEALQEAKDLRQFIVAGYNSCAITQKEYGQIETRFHAMDGLARQMDTLLSKPSLSKDESRRLEGLVDQYSELASQRGSH